MLLWIAVDYQFNRQAFLASYCPYQLLYGCEPILPNFIQEKLVLVVDLDDPNIWIDSILPKSHAYGHGKFVHCLAS